MKKSLFLMSLMSMLFAFSIISYAREAISDVNIDIVCTKDEITVEDIYIQVNTPHYTCERKEFQPVTQNVTLYLRQQMVIYLHCARPAK